MLKHFIKKVHRTRLFRPSPRVLVCVPCGSTQVERRAIKESAEGAGARDVYLIEEPMAAAIGAGIPVHEARGSMVLDIGGGTSEVAVISLNGIVYSASVRIGGDRFDEAIINYVRRNHGTLIGESTAERIKMEIGCAFAANPGQGNRDFRAQSGRGRAAHVHDQFQRDPGSPARTVVRHRRRGASSALEQTPPELCSDVAERGIVLTGGGAQLCDLDKLISEETGLHVHVADDPLTCVARGGGRALELDRPTRQRFLRRRVSRGTPSRADAAGVYLYIWNCGCALNRPRIGTGPPSTVVSMSIARNDKSVLFAADAANTLRLVGYLSLAIVLMVRRFPRRATFRAAPGFEWRSSRCIASPPCPRNLRAKRAWAWPTAPV